MIEEEGKKNSKILIFLALGVLFALIIGIIIWGSSKPELKPDPISIQCQYACEIGEVYGFCSAKRNVEDDVRATCKTLAEDSQYAEYNVESCLEISCGPQDLDQTCVSGLGGTWESPTADGECSQGGAKIRRPVTPSDEPPIEGQICCR